MSKIAIDIYNNSKWKAITTTATTTTLIPANSQLHRKTLWNETTKVHLLISLENTLYTYTCIHTQSLMHATTHTNNYIAFVLKKKEQEINNTRNSGIFKTESNKRQCLSVIIIILVVINIYHEPLTTNTTTRSDTTTFVQG